MRFTRKIPAVFAAFMLLAGMNALSQGRIIYSESANAHADISASLRQAKLEHKNVIVDFGGNWCGDCQVLDIYFHQAPNAQLLAKNFILVHVNIGRWDTNLGHYEKNQDIAAQYDIPLHNGVPLLMVLDGRGKVLYIQRHKEFEKMQIVTPASVSEFLNQWKPKV